MPNADPASEVRAMYKTTLANVAPVYDAVAPSGAGVNQPYIVIQTVDAINRPVRDGFPEYRAVVNLIIPIEFRENGGSVAVDDVSSQVLDILVPSKQDPMPVIAGWSHVLSRFVRTTTFTEYTGSIQVFSKRLVIEHIVKLNP